MSLQHDHAECDGDHGHHGHHHHEVPADAGGTFVLGIGLNAVFVVAEILYGLKSHSLALLSDAIHNAGDVAGLLMAWTAIILARRKPSQRFTYGLQSSSIIAALSNAVLLLVVTGGVGWDALQRLQDPPPVAGMTVMIVAAIGILINGTTALLFVSGNRHDMNIRGAFLHMAADALISLGVVISGLIIMKTGWLWLDPVVGLAIAAAIIAGTLGLLKDSARLALHAVPKDIDTRNVRAYLSSLPGIDQIHDLHIWAMSTTETALTAHLLIPGGHPGDDFIKKITDDLARDFSIGHVTIQIEIGDHGECDLAARHPA